MAWFQDGSDPDSRTTSVAGDGRIDESPSRIDLARLAATCVPNSEVVGRRHAQWGQDVGAPR